MAEDIRHWERSDRKQEIPVYDLTDYRPVRWLVNLIPLKAAERLKVLPLDLTADGRLIVAAADPLNVLAQDELAMLTGYKVEFLPALPEEIFCSLKKAYEFHGLVEDAAKEFTEALSAVVSEEEMSAQGPVIRVVDYIIRQALRDRASDLHIEPTRGDSRVRFRVDGALNDELTFPKVLHRSVISRIKIMANIDIAQKRIPQDGKIPMEIDEQPVDLRISTLPTLYGEKVAIRILNRAQAMVGLDGLGCDGPELEILRQLASRRSGLVLCVGPTGSGKTTTLYSLLEMVDRTGRNVITLEDPVEYEIEGVSQVQIDLRSGLTFPSALRSILRQDPDVIMVGEIRDSETAALAVRAALTGHLVFSSLHTMDAPSAPFRLIDMGIPPFLVVASLSCVIAQRLLRCLCPHCRQSWTPPDSLCQDLEIPLGSRLWRAAGCRLCRGSGYRGRSAVFEIMEVDADLSRMILNGRSRDDLASAAQGKKMRSLNTQTVRRALEGMTSIEEALSAL